MSELLIPIIFTIINAIGAIAIVLLIRGFIDRRMRRARDLPDRNQVVTVNPGANAKPVAEHSAA